MIRDYGKFFASYRTF